MRDTGRGDNPKYAADGGGYRRHFERAACVRTKPVLTQKALKNDINSNCYLFKDTYVVSSALATSGSIVRWFRDEFEPPAKNAGQNSYDRMFASLTFEGGTLMAVPYFAGSTGDSFARGAFLGLTLDTTRQQMLSGNRRGYYP